MEFGIFHEFPSLPGRSHAEAFAQSFELVDGAERWGLDAMWLGELHFDPARSVLSAPLCIASAIAARTQRMKIGLAVQVLPLCHPLRLAEEAATVDQISNGRLIFGVGRSGVARTYEAYGVPYARKPRALRRDPRHRAQGVDAGDRCRTRASTIASTMSRWCRSRISSRRRRSASPPRVPIRSYPSAGRACRYSSPCATRPRPRSRRSIARLSRGARGVRRSGGGGVFLRVPAYIAPTDAQARAEAEPSLIHFYRQQAALLADSAKRAGVDGADRRAQTAQRLETMTYEEALKGTVLIGSPGSVAERLEELRQELGLDGVLMELNCGGRIPHANVMTALRLLCQDVMPKFH